MSYRLMASAAVGLALLIGLTGASGDGVRVLDVNVGPLLSDPKNLAKLPQGVKFTFGDAPVEVVQSLGEARRDRSSVRGARTMPEACRWAMLGVLKALGEDARAKGGNAVVRLKSSIDDQPGTATTFRCRTWNNIVHVAATGELAQVK